MIVEIGTSDFRTLAGKEEGLFIEPVKHYFDRLPSCNKINVAISNFTGQIEVFYIPSDVIKKYSLPNWVRGCNSVGIPHPTIVKNGWDKHVKSDEVSVKRIKDVLEEQNITSIDFLKIDTEGHDCIILNDYLDTVSFLPNKIQFENNELADKPGVIKLVARLYKKGYKCIKNSTDMVLELNQ